jgi:maleate cis-trans isomerase
VESTQGFTATLGLVKPGTVDRITQDFWRMTPPDVNLTLYGTNWSLKMLHPGHFDAEAFDAQREAILESVRELLLYHELDFVAVSGDLIQSAMGPAWDQALRDSIREVAGVPATTAMTALTDALQHVGARRVAVGTPFRQEHNDYIRGYLEQAGFAVTAVEGYPTRNTREIRALPANAAFESGKKAFQAGGGADAIYLSCPVWPSTNAVLPLEQELGVPVITMFNPILWRGLSAIGYRQPIRGFGRLLETVGS